MALKKVIKTETKKPKGKITKRKLMEEKLSILERNKKPSTSELLEIEELSKSIQKSKLGSRSKNKGSNYERTVAKFFKNKYDIDLTRTPQSGGFAKKSEKADNFRGDIITVDKDKDLLLHIECKNSKSLSIRKWLDQSEEDCPKEKIPVVIFHQHNSSKDYITLSLKDFTDLVEKNKIIKE